MKQKFFIDFDDTMVCSSEGFYQTYKQWFGHLPEFKETNIKDNNDWNFINCCPLLEGNTENVNDIFASKDFFNNLEPQPHCQDILNKYKDVYDYVLVSIGTPWNLKHKMDYVNMYFPMVQDLILLNTKHLKMNKSLVNMSGIGNVFLDDHQDNLNSAEVSNSVLFKSMGIKKWNKDWQGISVTNWDGVDSLLNKYMNWSSRVCHIEL